MSKLLPKLAEGPSGGRVNAWRRAPVLLASLALGLGLPAGTAAAQAVGQAQSAGQEMRDVPPICFLSEYSEPASSRAQDGVSSTVAPGEEAPTILLAACKGTGIVLGEADRYSSRSNDALGLMLVEIERLGRTRVMLLSYDAADRVQVENLTGSIAVAADRLPTSGLARLTLDYSRFAEDGSIGLAGQKVLHAADPEEQPLIIPVEARLDVAEHVAREQVRADAVRQLQTEGAL